MLGFVCPSKDRKEGSGWDAVELEDEFEFEIDEGGVVAGGAVGAGRARTRKSRRLMPSSAVPTEDMV